MDDFNRQFSEQQSFDMHEISPNKPQKTKSRFGVGFVVGIAVGIAIAMAGLVVYGLITYKRVMEITSGQTAYSYDSYEDKVNSILQYLGAYYDGEIDEQAVEDSIASGVLNGIGDRYAKYYSKEEFQRMMEDSSGEYSGVGISVILDDDGKIVVYKVFPGTPAESAPAPSRWAPADNTLRPGTRDAVPACPGSRHNTHCQSTEPLLPETARMLQSLRRNP